MDQEKIGKLIKEIRKKNNLTQAEFAEKYGVTYQAVSKWENGKNIPDVSLLKEISKDFNVNIEDLLEGRVSSKNKSNKSKLIIIIILLSIIVVLSSFIIYNNYLHNHNFEFKTLTSSCSNFKISGSIAYNDKKSSIYISNITYCNGNDITEYKKIECVLYESSNNTETKMGNDSYKGKNPIKLEDYLKDVRFNIDNYSKTCINYKKNRLYLQISATDENNKVTLYKVPLTMTNNC